MPDMNESLDGALKGPFYVVGFLKPVNGYYSRACFYSEDLQGFTGDFSKATQYTSWGDTLAVVHFRIPAYRRSVNRPQRIFGMGGFGVKGTTMLLAKGENEFREVQMDPTYFYSIPLQDYTPGQYQKA